MRKAHGFDGGNELPEGERSSKKGAKSGVREAGREKSSRFSLERERVRPRGRDFQQVADGRHTLSLFLPLSRTIDSMEIYFGEGATIFLYRADLP